MDRTFLAARIEATKTTIVAYETAITALGDNGAIESYTLDTSQSRQVVTRGDIPRLNAMLDSLYNRLAVFEARMYGGAVTVRPAW